MRILITGPRGFVGRRLMQHYPLAIPAPSLQNCTEQEMRQLMETAQPDVIIHTAAISDIPTCEANPESSYRANVELPLLLARCNPGAKLICFSSDQVYSGHTEEGPYTESMTMPSNLYSRQKLEMEKRVLELDPNAVMLRAEWMYDYVSYKGNYFLNVLNAADSVSFSSGQYRGVTYLREVAEAMDAVMKLPGGAYNFGSETQQSMYQITKEFTAWLGKNIRVEDVPARHNLWMDCGKARALGVTFSDVAEGLRRCAQDYQNSLH